MHVRSWAVAFAVLAVLVGGCGDDGGKADTLHSPLGRAFARCLTDAGLSIIRSPSDLEFARGTSLYGDEPAAGTDVVTAGNGWAAVSFMPDDGEWRIYTLSRLAGSEPNPDYDLIWARLFDHPEALEVVAVTADVRKHPDAADCMDVPLERER